MIRWESTPKNHDMSESLRVLSFYDGFFSGGARIVHIDVIEGLHNDAGQLHSAISVHDEVEREFTVQKIEDDNCYKKLTEAGIAVTALKRKQSLGCPPSPFMGEEIDLVEKNTDESDIILSLKEQPLRLINEVDTETPVIACLHRADPEEQGTALSHLERSIELGKIVACVCCADLTKQAYIEAGLPRSLLYVIPNGVDLQRFSYSAEKRHEMRQELGIEEDSPVVVFAARYEKVKNIPLFLSAAKEFLSDEAKAQVIMCGAGMSFENRELTKSISEIFGQGVDDIPGLKLLGIRLDMDKLYTGADIVSLTSHSEGFGLTLAEGLASGSIPVSTDVGDAERIIGKCGLITSEKPDEIAHAWQTAFENRPRLSREIARSRYRLDRRNMISAYARLINEVYSHNRNTSLSEAA